MKIKKYILLSLPYVLFFLLGCKLGEAYRLSAAADIPNKIIDTVTKLDLSSLPAFFLSDILVGLAADGLLCGFLYYRKKTAKKYRKDVEHGSACWGTAKDIEPYIDPEPDNNVILTKTESLTMNPRPSNPKYARNKNVLVVGGSGSGKTRFFLKPNLMQMHSSYIVTDPKGMVLIECGKLLQRGAPKMTEKIGKDGKPVKDKKGNVITEIERDNNGRIVYEPYKIKVLNTIDFSKSMHYNPFEYIRSEKDILKFVTALIANTTDTNKKGGDDFWQKSEQLLYQALIGLIYHEAPDDEKNINTLVEFINAMEVREEDEIFQNAVDMIFTELEEADREHFAVRQYKKYKLAAGKTAKSILISCGARLAPFDIKEINELMAYDEMGLDRLGDEKTALFVIISDTDTTFNFVAALMYSQLFNLLCDHADNDCGGRLRFHVRFLLDEFANIGQIPNFDKLIATIRSREISACIILQTQSQLKNMYKDNAETIIGNCDAMLFLGGREKTTLKDLAENLGKETIDMVSTSENRSNSTSYGRSFQKLGKQLMSIDELAVMDGSKCILQLRGVRPFFSDKFDITKHKNYRYLSDYRKENTFDINRYLNRKLKVKENDVYEFFEVGEIDSTAA